MTLRSTSLAGRTPRRYSAVHGGGLDGASARRRFGRRTGSACCGSCPHAPPERATPLDVSAAPVIFPTRRPGAHRRAAEPSRTLSPPAARTAWRGDGDLRRRVHRPPSASTTARRGPASVKSGARRPTVPGAAADESMALGTPAPGATIKDVADDIDHVRQVAGSITSASAATLTGSTRLPAGLSRTIEIPLFAGARIRCGLERRRPAGSSRYRTSWCHARRRPSPPFQQTPRPSQDYRALDGPPLAPSTAMQVSAATASAVSPKPNHLVHAQVGPVVERGLGDPPGQERERRVRRLQDVDPGERIRVRARSSLRSSRAQVSGRSGPRLPPPEPVDSAAT